MDKRLIKLLKTYRGGQNCVMLDTYNQAVHEDVACTIRTNINTANHHFIMEKKRDNTQNYVVEPINTDQEGNASTITAGYYKYGSKTLLGGEYGTSGTAIKEVIELPVEKRHQQDAVQHEEGISRCLVVGCHGNSDNFTRMAVSTEYGYRIRKLTERECFRLMGVCEEYIDLIQAAGISRSQRYKMAGNSIVVDVLVAIFRQLLIGNKNAYQQLEIF